MPSRTCLPQWGHSRRFTPGRRVAHQSVNAGYSHPPSSLRRLVLGTNVISAIEPPKVFTEERPLRNLTHLVVSSNTLGRWDDINALAAHFPRLESLNIMGNPIGDRKSVTASLHSLPSDARIQSHMLARS